MKVRIFHWYNVVLTVLLAVLGYGCSKDDGPEEYGTPSARYQVSGMVTDEAGNPIEGIRVSVLDGYSNQELIPLAKNTDAQGKYNLLFESFPEYSHAKIIAQDVDGDTNGGEFANDTIGVDYKSARQIKEGEGIWYRGTYQITQNIQLKKK